MTSDNVATRPDSVSANYLCPTDHQPCEVVAAMPPASASEALERVRDLLPCSRCRAGVEAAKSLRCRLGALERRALLAAPRPPDRGAWVAPASSTLVGRKDHERAIRKLLRVGLLQAGRGGAGRLRRQVVLLSPLGEAVVAALGDQLKAGRPIRWSKHGPAVASAIRLDTADLVGLFGAQVRAAHKVEKIEHEIAEDQLGTPQEPSDRFRALEVVVEVLGKSAGLET